MSITYNLHLHQKHDHVKFAYVDGHHLHDFAEHKHDFSELFLVISGSGKHSVAGYEYSLNKGDVFVINGDVEHGFRDVNQLKVINLMFDQKIPFFETPFIRQLSGYQAMFKIEPLARQTTDYQAKLTLESSQLSFVKKILREVKIEYYESKSGFEVMLTSLMQQLVVTLARQYQRQSNELPQTTLALSRALIFIEQNFNKVSISSTEIAKAAFISRRQLERLFRDFLGKSPNNYLRELQLNFAAKLLCEESQRSIQYISEQCGFRDSNYFSKCFKSKFNYSPRVYRNQLLNVSAKVY
ncbi:helix-turn-helix domain-containing protein [Salinivibrio sp. VYel6]|uniref:helix-turn-helix domain-containing protein n=1 Tax=Salinivibrio sp. VYel6 TaxID=2490493 RepID=UPI00128DBF33|nr:AraC family transcriptional regulator [Salinivibrio sp. VYel6]MPX98220.1 helix-turn-helix domain-containing protein [Salinivibrio sp. VYel6]